MNSRCFCWFLAGLLVHQYGISIQSSTKMRETFWQITQKLWATKTWDLDRLIKNKSFITSHFLGFFHWAVSIIFLLRDSENNLYREVLPETGLLIFHTVTEPRNSGKSAKSCKIPKNTQNTVKFSRKLIKYVSVQHIWDLFQLLGLFTSR